MIHVQNKRIVNKKIENRLIIYTIITFFGQLMVAIFYVILWDMFKNFFKYSLTSLKKLKICSFSSSVSTNFTLYKIFNYF